MATDAGKKADVAVLLAGALIGIGGGDLAQQMLHGNAGLAASSACLLVGLSVVLGAGRDLRRRRRQPPLRTPRAGGRLKLEEDTSSASAGKTAAFVPADANSGPLVSLSVVIRIRNYDALNDAWIASVALTEVTADGHPTTQEPPVIVRPTYTTVRATFPRAVAAGGGDSFEIHANLDVDGHPKEIRGVVVLTDYSGHVYRQGVVWQMMPAPLFGNAATEESGRTEVSLTTHDLEGIGKLAQWTETERIRQLKGIGALGHWVSKLWPNEGE